MAVRTIIADDDEPAVRHLLRLLEGFPDIEVIGVAVDGQQALELIERLRPALVLLDIGLPLLNGFEIYEQLLHRPLIVFITAATTHRKRAEQMTLAGFFGKPVGRDEMERLIDKVRGLLAPTH